MPINFTGIQLFGAKIKKAETEGLPIRLKILQDNSPGYIRLYQVYFHKKDDCNHGNWQGNKHVDNYLYQISGLFSNLFHFS